MKFALPVLGLLLAMPLSAQTRVLAGAEAGSSFGNLFAGPSIALEQPIPHAELDAADTFSPAEQHIALGSGWANTVTVGGIGWVTKDVGLFGSYDYSQYHVTLVDKGADYGIGGLVLRRTAGTMPYRLTFGYVQQLNTAISSDGTEAAFLKAGSFKLDMRVKCAGPACYRLMFNFQVGHVLTQSNPVCDGTFGGPVTCARTGASSGTFVVGLYVEFPRRRATEEQPF